MRNRNSSYFSKVWKISRSEIENKLTSHKLIYKLIFHNSLRNGVGCHLVITDFQRSMVYNKTLNFRMWLPKTVIVRKLYTEWSVRNCIFVYLPVMKPFSLWKPKIFIRMHIGAKLSANKNGEKWEISVSRIDMFGPLP